MSLIPVPLGDIRVTKILVHPIKACDTSHQDHYTDDDPSPPIELSGNICSRGAVYTARHRGQYLPRRADILMLINFRMIASGASSTLQHMMS